MSGGGGGAGKSGRWLAAPIRGSARAAAPPPPTPQRWYIALRRRRPRLRRRVCRGTRKRRGTRGCRLAKAPVVPYGARSKAAHLHIIIIIHIHTRLYIYIYFIRTGRERVDTGGRGGGALLSEALRRIAHAYHYIFIIIIAVVGIVYYNVTDERDNSTHYDGSGS